MDFAAEDLVLKKESVLATQAQHPVHLGHRMTMDSAKPEISADPVQRRLWNIVT